ncbi:MAG: transcriptional coactivator p15/PC4 family protein [Spirochaetes bacterium]|nr:transcriptional coactivator p15/PC4 family protein [Spirochaetota bacterium]
MQEEIELGRIGFNSSGEAIVREPIIIKLSSFKNSRFLDVRKYFQKEDGWAPTAKGVTLQLDQIEDFVKIVEKNKSQITDWFDKTK